MVIAGGDVVGFNSAVSAINFVVGVGVVVNFLFLFCHRSLLRSLYSLYKEHDFCREWW